MTTSTERRPWAPHVLLLPLSLVWLLPTLLLVNGALRKETSQIFSTGTAGLTLDNLLQVWQQTQLARLFLNSAVVTASSVLLVVAVGALAGFGLAQHRFRGSGAVLIMLLSGIMLAPAAIIVPLYDLIVRMGLLNSYYALIGPYAALGMPAAVLLYRNAFLGLPRELSEAAKIDGAGSFRVFSSIYLPLVKTTTVTVVILQGLAAWNDYLLALLFMTEDNRETVQLAFIAFQGQYFSSVPKQFAVMALVMLPVVAVFVVGQRAFVSGLTAGAVDK